MADSVVDQFEALAKQLISEAWAYAGKGVYEEETDANIRRCLTANLTLQTSLQQAQIQVRRQ